MFCTKCNGDVVAILKSNFIHKNECNTPTTKKYILFRKLNWAHWKMCAHFHANGYWLTNNIYAHTHEKMCEFEPKKKEMFMLVAVNFACNQTSIQTRRQIISWIAWNRWAPKYLDCYNGNGFISFYFYIKTKIG